jgi:imidazolonepropionase-like amidohydrolase
MNALLMILTMLVLFTAHSKPRFQPQDLVINHVTVIDATGAPAKPNMTVIIRGDRIAAIDSVEKVRVPKEAKVVDATGKFLIPGLWDMHVHTSYKEFLTLFVANGVTGVRDLGGSSEEFEVLQHWQRQIRAGTLLGPRIVAAGIIIDGPERIGRPTSIHVGNETEGRQAVDALKQRGADFVKVYSMLPREAYFAIAAEAKKQGLPFAGHVPASVTAMEASAAGQKSMEHLFGVLPACSSSEADVRNEALTAVAQGGFSVFIREEIHAQIKALKTYDDRKAAALFAHFVKNGTWQVPTLAAWQALCSSVDSDFTSDMRLKYMPPEKRRAWQASRTNLLSRLAAEYITHRKILLEKQLELVGAMRRAGVEFMAGTDTAGFYLIPGFSLHDELVLLVRAGLTPLEALQAATRAPAKYLGLLDSLGTVEQGKMADLVLLEANPLEDISNTRKIAAVVVGGKFLAKSDLQQMLAKVEAEANQK